VWGHGSLCAYRLDGSAFAQQLAAAAQGQLTALGSLSDDEVTCLVNDVDAAQLRQRWAALAVWGVENAPGQEALNAMSRRQSATELLGRAQLGVTQVQAVKLPIVEVRGVPQDGTSCCHVLTQQCLPLQDRILAVLLSIQDEAERLAAVGDALTPCAAESEQAGDADEEMLSTTPPRLLASIDRAMALAMRGTSDGNATMPPSAPLLLPGGSIDDTVQALRRLRDVVIKRL
jgi:hypothetical protein